MDDGEGSAEDTENDGVGDWRDLDSDGDGYSDAVEATAGSLSADAGSIPPGTYSGGCAAAGRVPAGMGLFAWASAALALLFRRRAR